tara:strand:- start:977 stop:1126 length:150 start_codon:yes stop_codon:yes gene_type:complete
MEYEIIGTSEHGTEVLDTASNKLEAMILCREYIMSFGAKWTIKYKRKTK